MTERILPGIGLTGYWDQGAPWKVGGDQNWLRSSVLTQLAVESATTSLPASPLNGVIYIVPAGDANANQVAARDNGAWEFMPPQEGWTAYVRDTQVLMNFDGAAWVPATQPLAAPDGAGQIGTTEGVSAQSALDGRVKTLQNYTALLAYAGFLDLQITTPGIGGPFQYNASAPNTTDWGTRFAHVSGVGAYERSFVGPFQLKWFGALGNGIADDTPAFTLAVAACRALATAVGGAHLHVSPGRYRVTSATVDEACVWVDFGGLLITGDGQASEIFTTNNAHVPIHFSSQKSIATNNTSGAILDGFTCRGLAVRGTGVYQNFGLAKGRGILGRRVKNFIVTDCFISDMSMNGVTVEDGNGYFLVARNRITNCKYTAINYNGRAYQSIVADNICSGSDGDVNSIAIQVNGPSIVEGNTVYGNVTNYANCGGIQWGEGNYDGIGSIRGNLVTHCRFGIKAVYHGACAIEGNTIVNCRTTGGINLVGGTAGGFTVASSHNIVSGNLLINNSPYQIDCSAAYANIVGNTARNIASPTNPSANTEPDAILPVTVQVAIRVRAEGCSVVSNLVDGAVRGIVTTLGQMDGAMGFNQTLNCSSSNYAFEGDVGVFVGAYARDRRHVSGTTFVDRVLNASIPTQGYYAVGAIWEPTNPALGSPTGATIIQGRIDAASVGAAAGDTVIAIVGAGTFTTGANSKVGLKLDNGTYHWTTLTASAANSITIAAAIPVGRSVAANDPVYVNVWRPFANLA